MHQVPVRKLNQHTADVLARVEMGERVEITRNGVRIAIIEPAQPNPLSELIETGEFCPAKRRPPTALPHGRRCGRSGRVGRRVGGSLRQRPLVVGRDLHRYLGRGEAGATRGSQHRSFGLASGAARPERGADFGCDRGGTDAGDPPQPSRKSSAGRRTVGGLWGNSDSGCSRWSGCWHGSASRGHNRRRRYCRDVRLRRRHYRGGA